MIDWDRLIVRGLIVAAAAAGAYWYFLGPGAAHRAAEAEASAAELSEEGALFAEHARALHTGDALPSIESTMRRPADTVRRGTNSEDHVWRSRDGATLTVTVEIATNRASNLVFKAAER